MKLYQSKRHKKISAAKWNETVVKKAIVAIVDDVEKKFDRQLLWPLHPREDQTSEQTIENYKCLYFGAAGVIWGLHRIEQSGILKLKHNYTTYLDSIYQNYLLHPNSTEQPVPSYFLGEVGILLIHYLYNPQETQANKLFKLIEDNIDNPTNEALWGASGTMIAAIFMYEWTQEIRWRDLIIKNIDYLWSTWKQNSDNKCWLWTQDMYNYKMQYLGAGHGFAGNVYPLLRCSTLLTKERQQQLYQRCIDVIVQYASVKNNVANWPPLYKSDKFLVQWCHGAPGIITSMRYFPKNYDNRLEQYLQMAGELVWEAGPLAKGGNLCHGTAGNGYAFLQLYKRTGESKWLQRAQVFAMIVIEQYKTLYKEYNQSWYSLWTGDIGIALFLLSCLEENENFPGLDVL